MCHLSPASSVLSLIVTIIGALFVLWHIKSFDGGRCLLFSRRDSFRWTILMMLFLSILGFISWSGIMVWIKYHEAYGVVPISADDVKVMPVPFQLWSVDRQKLARSAYHIMSIGWGLMLAVHTEETLYWGYLINAIRTRSTSTWFKSIYFKLWIVAITAVLGIMPAVGCIETENILKMENNIFLAGSVVAVANFVSSLWLIAVFPGFVRESRKQGANPEVLGRLHYFKELNMVRTTFRALFASTLMALSVDGYTEHAFLNTTPFWTDTLFICAYFSAFISTCISLMILLPRSMTSEAGMGRTSAPVFIRPPTAGGPMALSSHRKALKIAEEGYRKDPERQSTNPWGALGERLNLDRADLEDLAEAQETSSTEAYDLPFAAQPGARIFREGEEPKNVPGQLQDWRGPLDVARANPTDLSIVVTSTTVVDKQ